MRILSSSRQRTTRRDRGGFTLIELLVVIGIIAIMTAMALPAINKFLKGQKLSQAGRMIQGAFNEARRAAITQRARHYIYFFRKAGAGGNPDTYSLSSLREGKGWETTEVQLPLGVYPTTDANGNPPTIPAGGSSTLFNSSLPIYDATDGPPALSTICDMSTITPKTSCLEFRKDGTLFPHPSVTLAPTSNPDLYDLNIAVADGSVASSFAAHIVLRQLGDSSKYCFVDIDVNTGRVRFRVVDTEKQGGGSSP